MNRRLFLVTASAVLLTATATLSAPPAKDDAGQKYEGQIADIEKRMIDVQTASAIMKFTVTETTKISLDGQPVLLEKLMVGYRVSLVAGEVDGKLVASVVAARTPDVQNLR